MLGTDYWRGCDLRFHFSKYFFIVTLLVLCPSLEVIVSLVSPGFPISLMLVVAVLVVGHARLLILGSTN